MARQMKSSGVEWIGDIPEKWDVCKIINCLSSIGSGTTPQGQEYYENEYIPWLNTGDLNDGYIEKTEKSVSEKALSDYSVLKRFDAGSVVVAMYGATVGKLGIVTSSLVTNQACCVMTSNEKLYNKFLFYLFMAGKTYLISLSLGSGQPNINQNTVKTFDIPFVPLSEQKEIADYLDDRCGKIDDFIAKQKTVIEKLKEYKQSVITEAVTKGLDSAAPMKSSGVDWIGDIPEDWNIERAKNIFQQSIERGNSDLTLLSATQDYGVYPKDRLEGVVQVKEDTDLSLFKTIHKNYFAISLRSFQGGFEMSDYEGVITPAYSVFYAKINVFHRFFKHLFKSDSFISKINSLTVGIREGKSIQYDDFSNLFIPYPPLSEQNEIADYLDAKCAKIDDFIAKKQTVIDKLTEYKKSLIYECVTGKQEILV
ncbi:MAG: restriction endonuclease subunit S [Alphaproteobacteria bacterium]|nr:restriction endonuclease subunit S [Alphaproteobacteria bacterium]